MSTPRGIRNNNPTNIIKSGIDWTGEKTSLDESVFEVFDTPEHGLEAACRLLLAYQDKHGLNTIRGIVNRWAPPSENDTGAYVGAVAAQTGIGADLPIDLHRVPQPLADLCAAIVRHENGIQPYPLSMILAAAKVALGIDPSPITAPVAPTTPPASASAPHPPRDDEELTDIPQADLAALVHQFQASGATVVTQTKQPDGLWTLRATYRSQP